MDTILEVVDKRKLTAILFIWIWAKRSIASITYILLQKLKAIWLAPSAVSWFNSYLSQRCQVINAALSDNLPVVFGVSQSSVLALAWNSVIQHLHKQRTSSHWDISTVRVCYLDDTKEILSFIRVVQYSDKFMHGIMYCIVFTVLYKSITTKKKEQNKTMRNVMSMSFTVEESHATEDINNWW